MTPAPKLEIRYSMHQRGFEVGGAAAAHAFTTGLGRRVV